MMTSGLSSFARVKKLPQQLAVPLNKELDFAKECALVLQKALDSGDVDNCRDFIRLRSKLDSPRRLFGNKVKSPVVLSLLQRSGASDKKRAIARAAARIGKALSLIHDQLKQVKVSDTDSVYQAYKLSRLYALALDAAQAGLNQPMAESASLTRYVHLFDHVAKSAEQFAEFPLALLDEYVERKYLASNQDVADLVRRKELQNGFEHFARSGAREVFEGRRRLGKKVDLDSYRHKQPAMEDEIQSDLYKLVADSGLLDERWYKNKYGETGNAILDFCKFGIDQGKQPNFYFDASWYLKQNPDVMDSKANPVTHYLLHGEKEGRQPSPFFDPAWYASKNNLNTESRSILGHYLTVGRSMHLSPNKVVDVEYYRRNNEDVRNSGEDAAEHCLAVGWREGRDPSADFNVNFYVEYHLQGDQTVNPLVHYLLEGEKNNLATKGHRKDDQVENSNPVSTSGESVSSSQKFFANPGPDFEEPLSSLPAGVQKQVRAIAFYLPQFYPFPENDRWWGKGFTEWRNVMRGSPRFVGHYQPRIPRDLGFYDLRNEDTIVQQAIMAEANGIEGFCFYYYWFNGKRLMDEPLDIFAASDRITTPFCIMWANENWTRTWDGLEKDVLIEQDYNLEDEDAFIEDTLGYFSNDRYIRVQGRPLFILYRPGLIPDAKATVARWKSKWESSLGVEPLVLMVQGFGDTDPSEYDFDGAIEFPPHKICTNLPSVNETLEVLDPRFTGHVVSYDDVVHQSLTESSPDFPLIKSVSPHWDNDARREGRGFVMHASTPQKYQDWLKGAIRFAQANTFYNESFVFINAWNEWAEGAYLEPDVHYGHAYLNATRRAVMGQESSHNLKKLLLVGHDAHPHGAQMLLLNLARTFTRQFGMQVHIVLQQGGPLLEQYEEYADVHVVARDGVERTLKAIDAGGYRHAVTNTSVTGETVPLLKGLGIKVVSLIHELPRLITEYQLEGSVNNIANQSDFVVFPADIVKDGFLSKTGEIQGEVLVRPQGIYKTFEYDKGAKTRICENLGIPLDSHIVLNVGYADLRKGFDLFINTARDMIRSQPNVHFVWVGGLAQDMDRWVYSDLEDESLSDNFHCVGFTDNVSEYFSACDCFFLTSREDPYPSVVLEAMSVGKPVVIFEKTTGLDDVVRKHGYIVPRNDKSRIIEALNKSLINKSASTEKRRRDLVDKQFKFDDYCFELLQLLHPELRKISVVVPNYNYDQYIEDRIRTVFEQSYPVFETVILDDKSGDNSVSVISDYVRKSGRIVNFIENQHNSGNTFKLWKKGLDLVRGDYIWIAEADDLATTDFLSDSIDSFGPDTVLSFSDSSQVDSDGIQTADSYRYYYRTFPDDVFTESFSMRGEDFITRGLSVKNPIMNVSSVLWKTDTLRTALDNTVDEVLGYKLVGDWRLYIEALREKNSAMSYLNKPLNVHRRHQSSVTHAMDHEAHLEEIRQIHVYLKANADVDKAVLKKMDEYIMELEKQFGLQDAA